MPVRPQASPDSEEHRSWVWPQVEGARLQRAQLETAARRSSLRLIRELRLWEQDSQRQAQQADPAVPMCDDETNEENPGARGEENGGTEEAAPRPLQRSSIFREGTVFRGTQRVTRAAGRTSSPEDWGVVVTIHEIDLENGRCSGDMLAENVPLARAPVVTHWEGEIVDGLNNSFITCKWGASYTIDIAHWKKFTAFAPIAWKVMQAHGRCNKLQGYPYIFMRWKENFFVNMREEGSGCSLTIAGFYYVCLSRETGKIEGYYYDPNSTPYQKLELQPQSEFPSFTTYSYA